MAGSGKRHTAALQKLIPVRSVFEGKNIILVDDSIIRGTVSKRTIALAKSAGANKILFASTFPPVVHPCIYGIPKKMGDFRYCLTEWLSSIGIHDCKTREKIEDFFMRLCVIGALVH